MRHELWQLTYINGLSIVAASCIAFSALVTTFFSILLNLAI